MSYPPPPTLGVAPTHRLDPDPPAGMTAALRWTCRDCGRAALDYRGNVYGSAVEQSCTTTPPPAGPTSAATEER